MVMGKLAAMAMAAGGMLGMRPLRPLMRSPDSLRPCMVENKSGFSKSGFVKAIEAAEAIAARKCGLLSLEASEAVAEAGRGSVGNATLGDTRGVIVKED